MAQRVPAEESGAPGQSAHRVKVGGKTRSGLWVARPRPPAPLFLGEGEERKSPGPGLPNPLPRNRRNRCPPAPSRGPPAGLGGPGVAGRAGRLLLFQRAHRRCWARSGCEPPAAGGPQAHACGGSALPAPFLSEFAPPLPPRSSDANLKASPAARALSREEEEEVVGCARPLPHPFTPVSPRLCRAPVQTPQPRALLSHSRLRPPSPSQPESTSCKLPGCAAPP